MKKWVWSLLLCTTTQLMFIILFYWETLPQEGQLPLFVARGGGIKPWTRTIFLIDVQAYLSSSPSLCRSPGYEQQFLPAPAIWRDKREKITLPVPIKEVEGEMAEEKATKSNTNHRLFSALTTPCFTCKNLLLPNFLGLQWIQRKKEEPLQELDAGDDSRRTTAPSTCGFYYATDRMRKALFDRQKMVLPIKSPYTSSKIECRLEVARGPSVREKQRGGTGGSSQPWAHWWEQTS